MQTITRVGEPFTLTTMAAMSKATMTSITEDAEARACPHTAGENTKCYSHFGEKFGSFSREPSMKEHKI